MVTINVLLVAKGYLGTIYWRCRGLLHMLSARRWYARLVDAIFDARYGLETRRFVEVHELDVPPEVKRHAGRYQPTVFGLLPRILKRVALDWRNYIFLDLGCGKGRVLIEASAFNFSQVIGVEVSTKLHSVARESLRRFLPEPRLEDISLICLDVRHYELPAGDLVVYLYNPFGEQVMTHVVEKIRKHCAAEYAVIVIYVEPAHAHLLNQLEALRCILALKAQGMAFRVYVNDRVQLLR